MRTAAYGTQGFRRQQAVVHRFSVAGTLNGGAYHLFSHYPGVCIPGDGLSRVASRTAPTPRGVTGRWQSGGIESGRTVHCTGRSRRRTGSRAVFPCLSLRGNRRQWYSLTRLSPGYRHDCPRPREGAGEEREARAGWGLPEKRMVSPCGEGSPLPGPLPPWRYPHGPVHGEIPGRSRPGSALPALPGKPMSAPLPGHGFPSGIAMTAPAPGRGLQAYGNL